MTVLLRFGAEAVASFEDGSTVTVQGDDGAAGLLRSAAEDERWRLEAGPPAGADPDPAHTFATWAEGVLGGRVVVPRGHRSPPTVAGRVY